MSARKGSGSTGAAPKRPADEIADELTRLLFTTPAPQAIIGLSAAVFSEVLFQRSADASFRWLAAVALAIMTFRVASVFAHRRFARRARQRSFERIYAVGNFAFSTFLAVFAFATFAWADEVGQLMAAILVVAYCAGVAARASVRPWIALPSIVLSALPLALLCIWQMTVEHLVIGGVLLALIAGSLDTILHTYRITLEHLTTRWRFARLAEFDYLTGLPNRFMLMQFLDEILAQPQRRVALHFVDLDHFKPVNDIYGHAAGDKVLIEVARRLETTVSGDAFSARLGGDEFIVVQPSIGSDEDAERTGRAIIEAVGWPYNLPDGGIVVIGASNGCHIVETGKMTGPEAMAAADAALYEAKTAGRGRAVVHGTSIS